MDLRPDQLWSDLENGTSTCARCGASFGCGAARDDGPCWCVELPVLGRPIAGVAGCVCPDCLAQAIAEARTQG
jgi:hypothetical protein